MKRFIFCIAVAVCLFATGCATSTDSVLFQTSTIDALLASVYDGELSCRELLEHGNFGIGTFDALDGEMVLLDSKIYQIKADGHVYTPKLSTMTPFATVCEFSGEDPFQLGVATDYDELKRLLDKRIPNQNLFYAIKISGKFRQIKTRSVPRQKKPYPPLKEITKNQPEFEMKNVSGNIVGFRCPPYVTGINVPGYHLHFISSDKSSGGHILSFELLEGICEVDTLNRYFLTLPIATKEFSTTDLSLDRSEDLNNVER